MQIEIIPLALAPRPGTRTCTVCGHVLPVDRFPRSGTHPNGRKRTCRRCFNEAERQKRRERGAAVRTPRTNARGQVRCAGCRQYLDANQFATRRRGDRLVPVSACKPCTRIIDGERRTRRNRDLARALKDGDRRTELKRRAARKRDTERRRFVSGAIDLLLDRGLTKAEIGRLADVGMTNVYVWHRQQVKVTRAVERRFGIVVQETADLPRGPRQAHRRLPHPALGGLLARCLPQVQAIPTRSGWSSGKRHRKESRRAA